MRAIRDLAIIFGAAIALQVVVTSCKPALEAVIITAHHPASCTNYEKGDHLRIDTEELEVVDATPGRLIVRRAVAGSKAAPHAADVTLLCLPEAPHLGK